MSLAAASKETSVNIDVDADTDADVVGIPTGITLPVSRAWNLAMQQAEELLATTNSPTVTTDASTTASCLIPNTRATEELVRTLVMSSTNHTNTQTNTRTENKTILPLPILNLGMPKLGSTTLYHYFKCQNLTATHWNLGTQAFEGLCMREASKAQLPPLATCSRDTQAILQMDVAFPLGFAHESVRVATRSSPEQDDCFFPQLSLLDDFHAESPHATFLLTFRPMEDWIRSLSNWHTILERLAACNLPNLPRGVPDLTHHRDGDSIHSSRSKRNGYPMNLTDTVLGATMRQFFCSHVLHVRNFVKEHPSHTLLELDLYDEQTPKLLDQLFTSPKLPQVNAPSSNTSCWDKYKGGSNQNKNQITPEYAERLKRRKENKQKKARRQRAKLERAAKSKQTQKSK